MFGIVGFPVVPIARAGQKEGINFVGMRNEQSASYAAQAASFLTGRPQSCLVVSGPGVIHALAGLANAKENCWPMVLIGGASATYQDGMGAFQEEDQVGLTTPYCKFSHRIEDPMRIPFYIEKAVRTALYGRPGPVYLDMPDDVILAELEADDVVMAPTVGEPPRTQADAAAVDAALRVLAEAERPLLIVGKGMAWSRAEDEIRVFIESTKLPFLASPMGKGVVPDDHFLSVGAARTLALQNADVIFLAGARLNWIMHFGLPPRFAADVRIVQLDVSPEEIGNNVATEVGLVGDGRAVFSQLNEALAATPWQYPPETNWRADIAAKIADNAASVDAMRADDTAPINYYRAYRDIVEWLDDDDIIVGEGANTMDIGRTQMANVHPRHRLDAGSYGTMGVGLGFAVAAAVVHPDKRVVAVQGDSAFGFSGMEMETIARHKLNVTVIIFNNSGIGAGVAEFAPDKPIPVNAYLPAARYEHIAEAFGVGAYYVEQPSELRPALDAAAAAGGPALVHIRIGLKSDRKPQAHSWHT